MVSTYPVNHLGIYDGIEGFWHKSSIADVWKRSKFAFVDDCFSYLIKFKKEVKS